jgi:hypothetical protein
MTKESRKEIVEFWHRGICQKVIVVTVAILFGIMPATTFVLSIMFIMDTVAPETYLYLGDKIFKTFAAFLAILIVYLAWGWKRGEFY